MFKRKKCKEEKNDLIRFGNNFYKLYADSYGVFLLNLNNVNELYEVKIDLRGSSTMEHKMYLDLCEVLKVEIKKHAQLRTFLKEWMPKEYIKYQESLKKESEEIKTKIQEPETLETLEALDKELQEKLAIARELGYNEGM